jgi:hypothetical protein
MTTKLRRAGTCLNALALALAGMVALANAAAPAQEAAKPAAPEGAAQMGDGPDGLIKNGKPVTKGWQSLFDGKTLHGWLGEKGYWEVKDGAIVGTSPPGTPHHHYMFSDRDYSDFELHIDVKLVGYNSGVCIRIQPKTYDDVPGYQVDMGDGYWGCLWDEHHRQRKIFDFPKEEADKILHKDDWNHYYVRAVGSHITLFLNGVRTADGDDPDGFPSGPLGFQLCHGGNEVASFRNIYIRTKFTAAGSDGKPKTVDAPPAKGTAPPPPDIVVP